MNYIDEKDGQLDFYRKFLPLVFPDSNLKAEDFIKDNNDGVINGNLLEFKLNVSDLNAVLFQCIKYLSALRIKGKSVPANIHIIDLNKGISRCYKSEKYLAEIEKVYFGGASKNNEGFSGGHAPDEVLDYKNNQSDVLRLRDLLKQNNYTKIHLDSNCILGWAKRYYEEVPNARKEDFIGDETGAHKTIGEIRNPQHFKDYIYPYEKENNIEFKHLMDVLNAKIQRADLGAFYTPDLYAKESVKLVMKSIERVPAGNDYIILDRCAGTGNLEQFLPDDVLEHCILSTYEYYEYKVLMMQFASKVRAIIPPTDDDTTFINGGYVKGANALTKEYLDNEIIKRYVNNERCTIILYENPPYSESSSVEHQKLKKGKESGVWKRNFIVQEMKREIKGVGTNDLANAFIWSAFKYYLRQPADSYIVYSPAKYWKAQNLVNKEFLGGFACNRKHFHASAPSCVMCVWWGNKKSEIKEFQLDALDIINDSIISQGKLAFKKLKIPAFSDKYYDSRKFSSDSEDGILLSYKGNQNLRDGLLLSIKPKYNDNIIAYLRTTNSGFDKSALDTVLMRTTLYGGHGFYIRTDNYLEKLPLFCAGRYTAYNSQWTETGRIMKSSDGAERYQRDVSNGKLSQYLLKCLLCVCLDKHNHIRSLDGSDGRLYRNELCLDGDTIASKDLEKLEKGDKEKELLNLWNEILKLAKQTEEYKKFNPKFTWGIYQISDELDISYKDEKGKSVYKYEELHSALVTMKTLVKNYYNSEIKDTLFEYEFLK